MSTNNVKSIPRDKGGEALQEFPPVALAQNQYTQENGTASSVISVTDNTVSIEVSAVGAPAAIRWVPRTETASVAPFASIITIAGATSNYTHIIQNGETRRFALPQEVAGASQGSVVGINRQAGLYQRIAMKSMGIGSVLAVEF